MVLLLLFTQVQLSSASAKPTTKKPRLSFELRELRETNKRMAKDFVRFDHQVTLLKGLHEIAEHERDHRVKASCIGEKYSHRNLIQLCDDMKYCLEQTKKSKCCNRELSRLNLPLTGVDVTKVLFETDNNYHRFLQRLEDESIPTETIIHNHLKAVLGDCWKCIMDGESAMKKVTPHDRLDELTEEDLWRNIRRIFGYFMYSFHQISISDVELDGSDTFSDF